MFRNAPSLPDPGMVYFLEILMRHGALTRFSCEGHPVGLAPGHPDPQAYIVLQGPPHLHTALKMAGFVEDEDPTSDPSRCYRLPVGRTPTDRDTSLRQAAATLTAELGEPWAAVALS